MSAESTRPLGSIGQIRQALIDYVYDNSLTLEGGKEKIPLDVSLMEVGLLDSFGVIELVAYIEKTWKIQIGQEDFTLEKMGSVNKMAALIEKKVSR